MTEERLTPSNIVADLEALGVKLSPQKYEEHDVSCPLLVLVGPNRDKLNWNTKWCTERIKLKNRCTARCKVATRLKKLM